MKYNKPASIFLLLNLQVILGFAWGSDSLGITNEAGSIYVMHQVEKQETLYSLSKRYGATIASIVENNQLSGSNLSLGAVLKIPWEQGVTHTVEPGETLYALSKKYQTTVEEIMKINSLESNDLEVGRELIILSPATGIDSPELEASSTTNTIETVGEEVLPPTQQVASSSTPDNNKQDKNSSSEAVSVQESGMAAVIDGNSDTRKYLALHPTAPVGTIMRVRNEMTNLSVFVRVVGKLPDTGANNNVLIRLSPAAQEALGALDGKFRVELSYLASQ